MILRALPLALTLLAGCNLIAGIADYRTVDAFDDGGAPDGGDAGSDAPVQPTCNSPDVPLRIAVLGSASGDFYGIAEVRGLFSELLIGHVFAECVPSGTQIELHALPGDPSDAVHDWGTCGQGRHCAMTVVAATDLEVELQ
jgi:hypothetical protein